MKHSAVIFDFDGTLLYTVKDLADAVNYAIGKRGYRTHSVDAIQGMVGNGVNLLVARALPEGYDTPDYEEIMEDFRAFYAEHCMDNTGPYPGIIPMLERLRDMGIRTAIATNKYQAAAEELRVKFFADTVPLIVGDAPGRERKPAPDSVFVAMETLGVKPSDCIYVGDTDVDMATAKNAGIDFCAVAWGYRAKQQLIDMGAELIADNAEELVEKL